MAKRENKKISITKLQQIANENFDNDITDEWYGEEIHINESIGFKDMIQFVNEVVDTVFLEDGNFVPEVIDFLIRSAVLRYYANFTMPQDVNEHYRLVYETDAFDFVVAHINKQQLDEMVKAINRKIKYICDTNIMSFSDKMQDVVSSFTDLSDKLENLFGGVDSEDINNAIAATNNGGIKSDMLVEGYINELNKNKMAYYTGPVKGTAI